MSLLEKGYAICPDLTWASFPTKVPSAQLIMGVPVVGLASRRFISTQDPTMTPKIDPLQIRNVFDGLVH